MVNKSIINTSTLNDEPFDVMQFVQRHFRVDRWKNERSQKYTPSELHELNRQVIEIFQKEPTLAVLSPPCYIVGDIHGQYRDLIRILNMQRSDSKVENSPDFGAGFNTHRYMFLGDFVDRGAFSVECICIVFGLKIWWPKQFMLLRGNHETKSINNAYGFREELVNKLGEKDGVEVWEHFNEAFSWMPLAGLVGGKILCMHGGISPLLNSLDDIRKIKRPLPDLNENKLALDLLWSDPLDNGNISSVNEEPQYLRNMQRGLSCTFNGEAIRECVAKLKIELIVRAHQVQNDGFKFSNDRKLVTVFSAPHYMKENDNLGAVLRVLPNGGIQIRILRPFEKTGKKIEHEVTRGDSSETDKDKKTEPPVQTTQSITKSTKSSSTTKSIKSSSIRSKRSGSKKSKRSKKSSLRKSTKSG